MRLLLLAGATIAAVGFSVIPGNDLEYSQPIPIVPVQPADSSSTTTVVATSQVPVATTAVGITVPTTTTTLVPDSARCPDWWVVAVGAGWPQDQALLGTLDWIMWRESRCQPEVIGDGSYGLTQLQWSVHSGWISGLGFDRESLLHPAVNLALAWELFQRVDADETYWCGFSPWYMSEPGRHWCSVWEELS